jgi:hypothetical protein
MANFVEVAAMSSGNYVIQASDLPLYALIRCGLDPGDIFMRPLAAGESRATVVCTGVSTQK